MGRDAWQSVFDLTLSIHLQRLILVREDLAEANHLYILRHDF